MTARTASTNKEGAKGKPKAPNAIDLLTHDHREVEDLFDDFKELPDGQKAKKRDLAYKICQELLNHTKLEEKYFYPAVRDQVDEADDLVKEALVEHDAAKKLIKEIQNMDGYEEMFDAKVEVLEEQILHHVEEEEEDLFPKVQDSSIDLMELGEKMANAKAQM